MINEFLSLKTYTWTPLRGVIIAPCNGTFLVCKSITCYTLNILICRCSIYGHLLFYWFHECNHGSWSARNRFGGLRGTRFCLAHPRNSIPFSIPIQRSVLFRTISKIFLVYRKNISGLSGKYSRFIGNIFLTLKIVSTKCPYKIIVL